MTIAATPGSRRDSGGFAGARTRFRAWRRSRPFWGAVVAIVGGVEIYSAAAAPLSVVVMQGLPGLLTMGVFLLTLILAGVTLYQPHLRAITGLIILILGPLSIMATNLGGFVIGMVLLVVGGGLILAWAPAEDPLDLAYVSGAPVEADASTGDTRVGRTPVSRDPASRDTGLSTSSPVYGTPTDDDATSSYGDTVRVSDTPVSSSSTALDAGPARPPRNGKPRPGQKRAPRTGLAGVFDTMFGGTKKAPPRPGQRRTPPGKRPAGSGPVSKGGTGKGGSGKSSAAKRPGGGSRPGTKRPSGSSGPASSSGSTGTSSPAGSTGSMNRLTELNPPSDPPTASARTWMVIPMLLAALATPAMIAGPASAAASPRSDGPLDWLFPPATPTPAPSATPTATPSSGLTLPTLPAIPGLTSPSPSATPDPSASATPDAVKCAGDQLTGALNPGKAADAAAAAVKDCATAAEAADTPVKATAAAASLPAIAEDRTTLKATKMSMEGFSYAGIETLDTAGGPLRVLHFKADSVAVEGMDETFPFKGGQVRIQNTSGTATLKGNVNLYVTTFKSNIYGLIPLTFSAEPGGLAPPLVLPSMFFTDATSVVALVQCDQILLPKLKMPVTAS